jgi:hypothetical protein
VSKSDKKTTGREKPSTGCGILEEIMEIMKYCGLGDSQYSTLLSGHTGVSSPTGWAVQVQESRCEAVGLIQGWS